MNPYKCTYEWEGSEKPKPIFGMSDLEIFGPSQKNCINYYIHDHLGNTRVTYEPEVTNCGPQTITYLSRDSIYYESLEQWVYDTVWLISSSTSYTYTIQNAFDYYPYGKVLREYNANTEKYLSTHHERDEETGWDYRNARYSESDIPRFGQIDPAMSMYPSMSPYSYVAGNPIAYIDRNGMNYTKYEDGEGKTLLETQDGSDDVVTVSDDKVDDFKFYAESYKNEGMKSLYDSKGWNDHFKSEFLGFESPSEMNGVLNQFNSQWSRQNAINYLQNPTASNAAAFSYSEALSQWTNPNLVISGLSAGVAGWTAKINVYRVYGNKAKPNSFSWTTVNPNSVRNYRDVAGLPRGNSGRFVLQGKAGLNDVIKSRKALPLDGNKGGLPELIINPKNVKLNNVSGANPQF